MSATFCPPLLFTMVSVVFDEFVRDEETLYITFNKEFCIGELQLTEALLCTFFAELLLISPKDMAAGILSVHFVGLTFKTLPEMDSSEYIKAEVESIFEKYKEGSVTVDSGVPGTT